MPSYMWVSEEQSFFVACFVLFQRSNSVQADTALQGKGNTKLATHAFLFHSPAKKTHPKTPSWQNYKTIFNFNSKMLPYTLHEQTLVVIM